MPNGDFPYLQTFYGCFSQIYAAHHAIRPKSADASLSCSRAFVPIIRSHSFDLPNTSYILFLSFCYLNRLKKFSTEPKLLKQKQAFQNAVQAWDIQLLITILQEQDIMPPHLQLFFLNRHPPCRSLFICMFR